MIITQNSLISSLSKDQTAADGPLGRRPAEETSYSKMGMWSILICSGTLAIIGLIICIISAARDRTMAIFGGVLVLLIGVYLMIIAVKEKANLDLISKHFETLSEQTKDELVRALIKSNVGASGGILKLIEKLINIVLKKDKL